MPVAGPAGFELLKLLNNNNLHFLLLFFSNPACAGMSLQLSIYCAILADILDTSAFADSAFIAIDYYGEVGSYGGQAMLDTRCSSFIIMSSQKAIRISNIEQGMPNDEVRFFTSPSLRSGFV